MPQPLHLSGDAAADELLASNPFALMVGMLLDQQVTMESAFAGPAKLKERLGGLDPQIVADCDPEELIDMFAQPPAVHRFPKAMAVRVHELARVLVDEYDGRAEAVWTSGDPDGPEILRRLKALPGFGQQKSQIFLALLGKQFSLQADGWRRAAGDYGEPDARRSIADVTDEQSLAEVRAFKKQMKAQAKAAKRA